MEYLPFLRIERINGYKKGYIGIDEHIFPYENLPIFHHDAVVVGKGRQFCTYDDILVACRECNRLMEHHSFVDRANRNGRVTHIILEATADNNQVIRQTVSHSITVFTLDTKKRLYLGVCGCTTSHTFSFSPKEKSASFCGLFESCVQKKADALFQKGFIGL